MRTITRAASPLALPALIVPILFPALLMAIPMAPATYGSKAAYPQRRGL
jgi:hypothetical protein